jgi:hypothetical protein
MTPHKREIWPSETQYFSVSLWRVSKKENQTWEGINEYRDNHLWPNQGCVIYGASWLQRYPSLHLLLDLPLLVGDPRPVWSLLMLLPIHRESVRPTGREKTCHLPCLLAVSSAILSLLFWISWSRRKKYVLNKLNEQWNNTNLQLALQNLQIPYKLITTLEKS